VTMTSMSHGDDKAATTPGPSASPSAVSEAPARKLPLRQRLSALFSEYGSVAIGTYLVLSLLAIIGFSVAFGFFVTAPESASGVLGTIIAGWVAAKATMPIRILITLAITPGVAHVMRRIQRRRH
jgi:hypothetical protein